MLVNSLDTFRALLSDPTVEIAVSDLDGVLRRFDQNLWLHLDEQLALPSGTAFGTILCNPLLEDVTRGRATHTAWRERIVADLTAQGATPEEAGAVVSYWADSPAVIDAKVRALLEEAASTGREVFVFTNGTDRVREELDELGLSPMLGENGARLLNTAELGYAKPDPEAYAVAHARIEQVLEHAIAPHTVAFLDDSAGHVEAARIFGWRGVQYRDDEAA